jgi:hypothetical protein
VTEDSVFHAVNEIGKTQDGGDDRAPDLDGPGCDVIHLLEEGGSSPAGPTTS